MTTLTESAAHVLCPPAQPWRVALRRVHLAFLHWPVPPAALRPYLPPGLRLDTFHGTAWLGVLPLGLERVRLRWLPPMPGLSSFLELDLRTYVSDGRTPGIWCFSLDCDSRLAVAAGRRLPGLPFLHARMACVGGEGWLHAASWRTHPGKPDATFAARYRPLGEPFRAVPGSLEEWLTARCCLYGRTRRGLYRCDLAHAPLDLQPCRAEVSVNTLAAPLGLDLPLEVPLAHYARRQDVLAWAPEFL